MTSVIGISQIRLLVIALAIASTFGRVTAAVLIPTLFNTGVSVNNANGTPAVLTVQETRDKHYEIIAGVDGAISPFVTNSKLFPFSAWTADSLASQWISPQANYSGLLSDPVGAYTYRTRFDLTGRDLGKVSITGRVEVDNVITAIRINGFDIGYSYYPTMFSFDSFSLPKGHYSNGTNTLEFDVLNTNGNGGNPSGFRVVKVG